MKQKVKKRPRRDFDGSDVYDGLAALGIEYENLSRDEIKINCLSPDHPDRNPSMHVNVAANAGAFKCWSCGFRGHLMEIFKDRGYDPFDEDVSIYEQSRRSMNRIQVKQRVAKPKQSNFFLPGDPWSDGDWRGIPEQALITHFQARHWTHTYIDRDTEEARIRYDSNGNPVERILFPVFFRKLYYGFVSRYLGDDPSVYEKDKYYNDPALPTKHLLYPYDLVVPRNPVILVEGPFDAIRLRVLGYNGLCIFGTQTWSESKVMAVLRLRPTQIILMMDADEAGDKAAKLIFQSFLNFLPEDRIVQFPMLANHDPGDVPEDYLFSTLCNIPRHTLTA